MAAAPTDADTSCDVADFQVNHGTTATAYGVGPPDRPKVRKQRFASVLDDVEELKEIVKALQQDAEAEKKIKAVETKRAQERAEAEKERMAAERKHATLSIQVALLEMKKAEYIAADIVEEYEAIDRSLRSFNDLIFSTTRAPRTTGNRLVLTKNQKRDLKQNGLDYITKLLDPSMGRLPDHFPPLSKKLIRTRDVSLQILTSREQALCRALLAKWSTMRRPWDVRQDPIPDGDTAINRVRDVAGKYLPELTSMVHSTPMCIERQDHSRELVELFAPKGTYIPVSELRKGVEEMEARTKAIQELIDEYKQAEVDI